MGRPKKPPADPKATTTIRRAPAKTMDEQIERNIYLATIAAEKQLSDGTAAAPVGVDGAQGSDGVYRYRDFL